MNATPKPKVPDTRLAERERWLTIGWRDGFADTLSVRPADTASLAYQEGYIWGAMRRRESERLAARDDAR